MAGIKSLAKDTAIYGLSSIVGRFLNWCLVPLYTILFSQAEYGVVTLVYAVVALALIILTYGMETGFFRFANHDRWSDPMEVYSTALLSLAVSSTVFFVGVCLLSEPVSALLHCSGHPSYALLMALAVALDAFTALPFSYLRFRKRPVRFAMLRLVNIGVNIGLNLFFLLLCPVLLEHCAPLVAWFYDPSYAIGYIFLSNAIASALTAVMLLPELRGFRYRFNPRLWREMMVYSLPLLVLGVAGIMNQTVDKIIFPLLYSGSDGAMTQLGIYGANYKIAIVMVMFTQAFRYAYEPFIFAKNKSDDNKKAYSEAMKYFIIFALFIFLGVMFYIDILKYFVGPAYYPGLRVVPIVMLGELFFGIYFNLSLWYKLIDQTRWGAYFSTIGCVATVSIILLFGPSYGYMACAWASFFCNLLMMLLSYFVGQKKFPIEYDLKSAFLYFGVATVLYVAGMALPIQSEWLRLGYRTILLGVFIAFMVKRDLPLRELPYVGRFFR